MEAKFKIGDKVFSKKKLKKIEMIVMSISIPIRNNIKYLCRWENSENEFWHEEIDEKNLELVKEDQKGNI